MDFIVDCILSILWITAEVACHWIWFRKADDEERRSCLTGLVVIISFIAFCSVVGAVLWWVFG